jgi:hypothetical protein
MAETTEQIVTRLRKLFAEEIEYAKNDADNRQLLDALCDIAGGCVADLQRQDTRREISVTFRLPQPQWRTRYKR